MAERPDPVQPADEAARVHARALLAGARFGALAFTDAETGTPGISRIAVGLDAAGGPVTLISALSAHHAALRLNPAAALMVGEPGPKGDPLTHPRLMIRVAAQFLERTDPAHARLRSLWLASHPKAKLYVDFGDFAFWRMTVDRAHLNGGFGKAYVLTQADLRQA
jgi:putative heme iron utilization protein